METFIFAVSFALGISAICSLMEATLLSLTPAQVADLSVKSPKVGAIWTGFKKNIEHPIAAILILNTAAHTIGASVAGAAFDKLYGDEWIWTFSIVFTFMMLQFTEILPKSMGVRLNRRLAIPIARPLQLFTIVFRPVIWFVHAINRPFSGSGAHGERAGQSHTIEEIAALAGLARLSREIGPHQERIIVGASKLSKMSVQDVMIDTGQASFMSTSMDVPTALKVGLNDLHTRYPVCEGNDRNRIVGYVNFKQLAKLANESEGTPQLNQALRPVHFVPHTMAASELLRVFIDQRIHLAIVRDAAETVLGMVTLEDLVEELVGELEDEFDRLPKHIFPLGVGAWLVGGGATAADIRGTVKLEQIGDKETVAEWLAGKLKGLPRPKQIVQAGAWNVEVRRIRRNRVYEAVIFDRSRVK